jgi:hemerythrin-like metal-binding protein
MLNIEEVRQVPTNLIENIFDREHLEIENRQQKLRASIIEGIGMNGIIARSRDLIKSTIMHFRSEESAMDERSNPNFDAHRLMHAEMIETLTDISSDLEHRRINGAMQLLKFFDSRINYHLEVEDVALERELTT